MKFDSLKDAFEINNLAYEIEKQNPKLSFFEVNKLVVESQQKETFGEALERLVNTPSKPWVEEMYRLTGFNHKNQPRLKIVK